MIHHHHSVSGEYLLIQTPKDLNIDPYINGYGDHLCYEELWGIAPTAISLPPGKWEIVGKASELSEEAAAEIVHKYWRTDANLYNVYGGIPCGTATALASLESLLSSKGMEKKQTLILKKL